MNYSEDLIIESFINLCKSVGIFLAKFAGVDNHTMGVIFIFILVGSLVSSCMGGGKKRVR